MSAARERAGRALYEDGAHDFKWAEIGNILKESWRKDSDVAHRASLDETDPALVEAIAQAMCIHDYEDPKAWDDLVDEASDFPRDSYRMAAASVIVAARNHIIGEGA